MCARAREDAAVFDMSSEGPELKQALEAIGRGDHEAAHSWLGPLAEGGDAEAQYHLGILYANGQGVPLDYVRGAAWLQKAAEQGHARAQSILAWLHATGFGVEQDDRRAGYWYLQAAAQGLPKDQYTVAAMYRWGRYGLVRDPHEMLRWYQRAANQGFAPAQYALGQLLARGDEIPRDPVTAFQWLSLAIVNGSEAAKKALMELSAEMTAEEIESAKRTMLQAAARVGGVPVSPTRRDFGHAY